MAGDAGEQVLVGLAGQQVTVVQRGLSEIGEEAVAAAVDVDADAAFSLQSVQHGFASPRYRGRHHILWSQSASRHMNPKTAVKTCRSEEHTSELQSLMRISYAVFCLKKNKQLNNTHTNTHPIATYLSNK